jgi:excisionase family DNA binding protein
MNFLTPREEVADLGVLEELNVCTYDFLTPQDVQKLLRIGRDKTRKLIQMDDFPSFKIGSSVRIPKEEFIDWYRSAAYSKARIRL